ncbi:MULTISPECIES: DUF6941 family protein [Actinomyces]|uniref:Uncharacterized protein n=1 Tax=Actinomyces respiraculi TaxID=2744574 RepID=A0A7T0PW18_9ACTO|nr:MULTISPECIES: hypothetical protein [Actinomyces]QPL05048.1 hypothetical protein ID810_09930 [Actinomyces respiraculi]
MLELDYAFLADYASIQGGLLTTVGASFTRMEAQALPIHASFAVAGRIRCDEAEREWVKLTIRFISPGEDPTVVEASNQIDVSTTTHLPYSGHRRGIVFALQMTLPLIELGIYTVEVDIDETEGVDRTLKFEVIPAPVT